MLAVDRYKAKRRWKATTVYESAAVVERLIVGNVKRRASA